MQTTELASLKLQNARLRKAIKDNLGVGIWVLNKEDENFTHEEILFLFSRIFPVFGIDYIKEIRTNFPDCICVKDDQDIAIEFEPILSSFRDHISKDDLSKCHYIVCWKDDLELHNPIREEIIKNKIAVIQLKQFYEEGKVKSRIKSIEWNEKDFDKLSENQLKALYAFIALDKDILTREDISKYINVKGKGLGGVLGGFKSSKEWLVRVHPKGGWQFNKKYRQKIIDTIKKFEII